MVARGDCPYCGAKLTEEWHRRNCEDHIKTIIRVIQGLPPEEVSTEN